MSDSASALPPQLQQRLAALSRWENEGGQLEHGVREGGNLLDGPPLTNTELVQLRVRVIALENVVMALLAEGTEGQRRLTREMADYILPRPDHTPHPMTIHAANRMLQLVDRADALSSPPRPASA